MDERRYTRFDERSMKGDTRLIVATNLSKNNDSDIVRLLLEYKVDPNIQSIDGTTSLMIASLRGFTNSVRLLLEHNADPNIQDNQGETALSNAASGGLTDVVRLLLEHKATPNTQGFFRRTPLILACMGGFIDIVRLLLAHNANFNLSCSFGYIALDVACKYRFTNIVRVLLEHYTDKNIQGSSFTRAFRWAVKNRDINSSLLLLQLGADSIIRDSASHLSLLASGFGNIDVLKRLLEYKVDVNTVYDGYTPLITASREGRTDIVRLLLVHNADPNIRCEAFNTFPKAYLTALDVAKNSDIKVLIRNQIRWYRRKAFMIMLAENGYIQSSPYVIDRPPLRISNIFSVQELLQRIVSYI